MEAFISNTQLNNLALFAAHLTGPLATVAHDVPKWPVRPGLCLPAEAREPFQLDFGLPAEIRAVPGAATLPTTQWTMLGRAANRLLQADIGIEAVQAVAYGLRLHLRRELEQGQVLIYHTKTGAWSNVQPQGPPTRLTTEAQARLSAPLPATVGDDAQLVPADTRLDLVAAHEQVLALARQAGWRCTWSALSPTRWALWLHDGHGYVQVLLLHGPAPALLHGLVNQAYDAAAAGTAHDFLRQLIGDIPLTL